MFDFYHFKTTSTKIKKIITYQNLLISAQGKPVKLCVVKHTPFSNPDFGIKAMASNWNSIHGTQVAILKQSFITGEHVINIWDYDMNLASNDLTLEPGVDVSVTFATHMKNLHLICLYPSKSFSGERM